MHRWRPYILTGGVLGSTFLINNQIASLISSSNQTRKSQIDPFKALTRNLRTLFVVGTVSLDYIINGRGPNLHAIHKRSAEKFRTLTSKNGGIYVKVAQHAAALDYLLPAQYTDALKVFQNEAPQSSIADIKEVICGELKINSLNEIFSYFDPTPLGSASLAQVHLAILKENGQHVAVKVQHKEVRKSANLDRVTIKYLVKLNTYLFPNFRFDWLKDLMDINLPKELNFKAEGENAETMAKILKKYNFNTYKAIHHPSLTDILKDICSQILESKSLISILKKSYNKVSESQCELPNYKVEEYKVIFSVPRIFWKYSTNRILVMEQCHGSKITDNSTLEQKNIIKFAIADSISKLFLGMIFKEDYIHVDPHPGNILVNIKKQNYLPDNAEGYPLLLNTLQDYRSHQKHIIEISLLDHGLYCKTSRTFRARYADLWTGIIEGDIELVKSAAQYFNIYEHYKILASMVSGRVQESVEKGLKNIQNSSGEKNLFRQRATLLVPEINKLLQSMPNNLIMVLKTNDLIRNILNTLELDESIALLVLASYALSINYHEQKYGHFSLWLRKSFEFYTKQVIFWLLYWIVINKHEIQM